MLKRASNIIFKYEQIFLCVFVVLVSSSSALFASERTPHSQRAPMDRYGSSQAREILGADIDWSSSPYSTIKYIHRLKTGKMLAVGEWYPHHQGEKLSLVLLNEDFTIDNGFQRNVEKSALRDYFLRQGLQLTFINLTQVDVDPNGKIYLLGAFAVTKKLKNGMAKFTIPMITLFADGKLDEQYPLDRISGFIKQLLRDKDGFLALMENEQIVKIPYKVSQPVSTIVALGDLPVNANIDKIILQPDGKIVFAGLFDSFKGEPFGGIVRLNADGSVERLFQANTKGLFFSHGCGERACTITGMQLQPDGKIVLTTNEDFTDTFGILRLNADGTVDDPFMENLKKLRHGGLHSYGVVLQDDGKILIEKVLYPIRIHSDGSEDLAFNQAVARKSRESRITLSYRYETFEVGKKWLFLLTSYLLGPNGEVISVRDRAKPSR